MAVSTIASGNRRKRHIGQTYVERHEQRTFASPYPCGLTGLSKKRVVPGCASAPFSLLLMTVAVADILHSIQTSAPAAA